jgi:hypothetical protein
MTDQIRENDSTKSENMLSIYCKMVICEGGQREVVHVSVLNSNCKVIDLNVVSLLNVYEIFWTI